jgi:DNA topoisomerase VI subunit A
LIKSDQDKLYSDSDYKLLKKKAKDMQFKLGVIKKELKERDAIIDELTQQVVSSEAASHVEGPYAGQKGADYWKDGK